MGRWRPVTCVTATAATAAAGAAPAVTGTPPDGPPTVCCGHSCSGAVGPPPPPPSPPRRAPSSRGARQRVVLSRDCPSRAVSPPTSVFVRKMATMYSCSLLFRSRPVKMGSTRYEKKILHRGLVVSLLGVSPPVFERVARGFPFFPPCPVPLPPPPAVSPGPPPPPACFRTECCSARRPPPAAPRRGRPPPRGPPPPPPRHSWRRP